MALTGGDNVDIWHRLGRIIRISNLGTVIFFVLNILLIIAVFGSSGNIFELMELPEVLYLLVLYLSLQQRQLKTSHLLEIS